MNITTAVKRRQTFIVVQVRFPVGPTTLFVFFVSSLYLLLRHFVPTNNTGAKWVRPLPRCFSFFVLLIFMHGWPLDVR